MQTKGRVKRALEGGEGVRARPCMMESEALLAGNVQRIQFLQKRTGLNLGVRDLPHICHFFRDGLAKEVGRRPHLRLSRR